MRDEERSFVALSAITDVLAVPYNFLVGFLLGVAAPLAAVAAMVLGVRFLTGKMPFLSLSREADKRQLWLDLVPAEEAGTRFATEKQKVVDELSSLQAEIKSMIEESKAQQAEAKHTEA